MAEISYQSSWYDWKTMGFSAQKTGKRSLFSETSPGISTLTQWTPCRRIICALPLIFLEER